MTTQLSIQDLSSIKQIIEVSSARGAFKANELKTVGDVYDRLSIFLESITTQLAAEEGIDEGSSAEVAAE